jgi:hypothetical protein
MSLPLAQMRQTTLTLEEMRKTPLTLEEMVQIAKEAEKNEENISNVVAMFDALLEDGVISEEDHSNLLEQLEELEPEDIAVLAKDSIILHDWIEGVLTFLDQVPCRYGTRCTQRDCNDDHPKGRKIDNPCRFRTRCTRPDCSYVHPEGREIDNDVVAAPTQSHPVDCKSGYYCRSRVCPDNHYEPREIDKKCNAGEGCTRPGCMFDHNKPLGALCINYEQ